MRLQIHHRTEYRYSTPVSENFNEVRLQPVSDAVQECLGFALATTPPAATRRYHDFHLNLVDHFYLVEPHSELAIEGRSTVVTSGPHPAAQNAAFPMARLDECLRLERCYDFLQKSEYVSLDVEVWKLAHDAAGGIRDVWEAARAMMGFVHRNFVYDAGATTVHSRVADVLRERRGVCQDFAHVLIGMCRSLRIPARYVSGYLYVAPSETLRGDLASHAWVEVFLPGVGWLPLDPTNDRVADDHHVKVAIGRDYADAAPVRGNFKGRASQKMEVRLDIRRLDDPSPAAGKGAEGTGK
ncbi:MAG: transglutaminase family protein [Verrucomicrobiales bacterium]|nr:transglutaminase family protein [Verrucomicrobiales bacterium]